VGAIVLVALSLAGYWFTGYRMSVDREAVAERLAGMDRHIAANVGDHGRKRLSLDVADLNQQLRALQGRVDDLAAAGAPGAWEQDKANLTQALDDLNGRLAKLEEQSAAAPARAAVASAPAPAAAPAAADTKPAGPAAKTPQVRRPVSGDDAWRKAQAAGHYTVQVVGASEQRSLRNFARRHHLQKDSAWFRTEFRGRTWLELFHGTYATRAAANEAAQALGRALGKASKPWPRPLPRKGELHPLD
jgi:septal ring-binding cell division protein DamX